MGGDSLGKRHVAPDLPVTPSLGSDSADIEHIALTAALHSPAALMMTSLAGKVVYGNIRAFRLFDREPEDFIGKNLDDFCIDSAQMTEIESVARDGRERQFKMDRSESPSSPRTYLCRVSRVAGRAGIPAWICFAAGEMEPTPREPSDELSEASVLESYRSVSGCAVWRMSIAHPTRQWLKNAVECGRERLSMWNIKGSPSARTAKYFIDAIHASDRVRVSKAIESSLDEGVPLEVVYRLTPKLGRSKLILTRALLVAEADGGASRSLLGFDTDITAPVERDQIPIDKAAILDTVAAHLEGPIYALDRQFRLLFFNECFSRTMKEQYGAQTSLHGKAFHVAAARGRRRVVMSNYRRALSGASVIEKLSIRSKISGVSSFDLMYAPLTMASQTTGVVVFGIKCQQRTGLT